MCLLYKDHSSEEPVVDQWELRNNHISNPYLFAFVAGLLLG